MINKVLIFISTCLFFTNLMGQSKINKDRNSILKMCGCFEIEFKFKETFQHIDDVNYNPSDEYRSFALELALPITNEKKKISIQHLLLVGNRRNKMIVKHWRQLKILFHYIDLSIQNPCNSLMEEKINFF